MRLETIKRVMASGAPGQLRRGRSRVASKAPNCQRGWPPRRHTEFLALSSDQLDELIKSFALQLISYWTLSTAGIRLSHQLAR